ncbi:G-type lectin S-receptor-like serine/threonine-protein kinase LECRK3 [Apium graveolens]|uniref:G-type lectin S-receptor-like serine/threonine-protein kinase LECRK3 n=1 Tax=Apium graveolens TaxID=4045 RepID=UPI003D7A5276
MSYSSSYTLCILICLFSYSALAQGDGTISVGSSLTAADKAATSWYSPSGDFAFGFRNVEDQFLLAIWYDKIPDKTIVWYVNDGTTVPAGSKVQLTVDRGLVLSDSRGNGIWTSKSFSGTASNAAFNDTGNFRIVGSDTTTLWDTFSNPTDTLLPTQTMDVNGELYSRKTETNFTRGRFQLRLLDNGNLVLNTRNILTNFPYRSYYESNTSDKNPSNQGYQVKFNESGYLYILRRNGDIFELTTNKAIPSSGYYHRATLTYDGILVQYYHLKIFTGTTGWTSVWQEPVNICTTIRELRGGGACGLNSICKSDGSRKDCECPETYSLLDPNDKQGGCKPNFTQNCDRNDSSEDLYDFVESPGTDWLLSAYEQMDPISEPECKRLCLIDCFCVAAYYKGNSCWKKKLPLVNGRKDNSVKGKTYLKFSKANLPPELHPGKPIDYKKKKNRTLILVGSVLLGSSVFVNLILIVFGCFGFLYIYHKKSINIQPVNNIVETNVCRFTNNELVEATNGFKEEVGRGSFGIVYKGLIHMSSTVIVAVKKIDRLVQDGAEEFKTEVNAIAQTHHKNLVRLIGFCEEEEHRLLVYEYMVNGTLANLIFGCAKPSWAQRKHIALGIARGLVYLHEECNTQIIHCDIKPQNILLDEYYNARISDFGLAKLLMLNQSRTKTGIRGTKGYVAPEWFRNTPITAKVDVYSFGVLLLEIICCRRSVENIEFGDEAILTDWVWDCFQDGRMFDLIEKNNKDMLSDWDKVKRFVMVGIWCIQEDPSSRPTTRRALLMLEGVADIPYPPCPSPLSWTST